MPKAPVKVSAEKIARALDIAGGNITQAAQRLGVSAAYLSKRLRRDGYRRVVKWEKDGAA